MKLHVIRFLYERLTLAEDMAEADEIRANVEAGIQFRGTNLWVLLFAILVASVGLNVNSTAVIIGAMLISPLMGPIVAIGYGAALTELGLIRRGAKNLLLAAVISLAASALYFSLTPLTDAGSELLGRTSPTTWDVLIALFGGAAGAVGITRRERGNVIPGVAIATALMPPLCTAGYGLATAHWAYFGGALYLFFINCVFISISTFLVIRILPLARHHFVDEAHERRVRWLVWGLALLTAAPSVYLAVGIVRQTTFTHNAQLFVDKEFLKLPGTYVLSRRLEPDQHRLTVLITGKHLNRAAIGALGGKLASYGLPTGTRLRVRQGTAELDSAAAQALRTNVLEDLRDRNQQTYAGYEARFAQLQQQLASQRATSAALPPAAQLLREARVNFPAVRQLGLGALVRLAADSLRTDTLVVVSTRLAGPAAEKRRFQQWLQARLAPRPVQWINE